MISLPVTPLPASLEQMGWCWNQAFWVLPGYLELVPPSYASWNSRDFCGKWVLTVLAEHGYGKYKVFDKDQIEQLVQAVIVFQLTGELE